MKRNNRIRRHLNTDLMKTVSIFLLILAASVAPATAAAPVWDSSGNSQLNGNYYFRQVLYQADAAGNASGFYALFGNIAFNGAGAYSISNATFLSVTSQGPSSSTGNTATGTYSVSASGYGFMSSTLLNAQNVYFLVSKSILIGSETESGNNDLFIAAPIGSLSNSSFQGAYTFAGFFPGGAPTSAADATYQLNPNGAGSLGSVSISGFAGSGSTLSQNSSGVTYKFSNNAAVITFPTNNNAPFYTGQSITYFSPDGNFVFGGSETGFDMFIGVRNVSSGTATPLSGLYYEAGIEETGGGIDSFYGTFNALQGNNIIGHERLLYSGQSPEGFTYKSTYPANLNGTYADSSNITQYTIGQNGFRLMYENKGLLGIGIALPYTPPAPPTAAGTVYIDPTGVVNTASSAPYTAGVSPGDFLTLYNGVNLSNTNGLVVESGVPIPTSLSGVQVLIDGLPSPVFYVSPTQLSVLVPYDVSTFPVASIQVRNNGVLSNVVTMFVNTTTPGVFTANSGLGVAAMLDFPSSGGYYIVSESQPAHPGDTVAAYLSGLGAPFPSNAIGAVGPADGSGSLVNNIAVDVSGEDVGTLAYAGLAPGLAGLYQINFTIPADAVAGDNTLGIAGPDSYTNEATLPIAASGSARLPAAAKPAARRKLPLRLDPGFIQ